MKARPIFTPKLTAFLRDNEILSMVTERTIKAYRSNNPKLKLTYFYENPIDSLADCFMWDRQPEGTRYWVELDAKYLKS